MTNSTLSPIPALSLCCVPGQGQLLEAPPCPCELQGVECDTLRETFRDQSLSPTAMGRDCCKVLHSPLVWLGVSRGVIALSEQYFSL